MVSVCHKRGYITDELTDYAIDWLDNRDSDKPFFIYVSHKAVHADFVPADRHRGDTMTPSCLSELHGR